MSIRSLSSVVVLILSVSFAADAQTKIAFFEGRAADGSPVQLEPAGRFFHIAVSVEGGGWLHAYPGRGVEYLLHLPQAGRLTAIITLPEIRPPGKSYADTVAGLPYDYRYNWKTDSELYCVELVQKATGLDIPLKPMEFASSHWRGVVPRGALGLSPDDYFAALKKRGYPVIQNRCELAIVH